MKAKELRIGNKGEGKFIKIPFDEPETLEEWNNVFGDNQQFLIDMALRGARIRIQDLTRETVAEELKKGTSPEETVDKVLDWLNQNDITAKRERRAPGPRKAPEVVAEEKGTYSNAELKAMLEAAGVKFVPKGAEQPA